MESTAGVDWASAEHAVCVVDKAGRRLSERRFAHDEQGLRALCRLLVAAGVARVALERPDGLLVERLLDAGLTVVAIHPNQIAATRDRYRAGGGKSDGFDAFAVESGKRKIACFRYACDKRLRDAVATLADTTRHHHPWARSVYQAARARGHNHPHAIRILGRAWLRVLWRIWQDSAPYDPARHGGLQRLHTAGG